jgi:hypothetical protein
VFLSHHSQGCQAPIGGGGAIRTPSPATASRRATLHDREAWRDSVLVWNGTAASVPAFVVRPAADRTGVERRLTLDLSDPPYLAASCFAKY